MGADVRWRRGAQGYASILVMLHSEGMTTAQLAASLGATVRCSFTLCLRRLRHHGLIHVSGFGDPKSSGPAPMVWRGGQGVEPAPVGGSKLPAPVTSTGTEMIAFAVLMRELLAGGSTIQDLAQSSGFSAATVRTVLRIYRSAGVVRISAWEHHAHIPAPVYAWGIGSDAPRPKPQPMSIVWRRYRVKRDARLKQMRMQDAIYARAA